MESFYSIIYYKTNALTDELVGIGLLAGGGEGPFMHISNARMDLLRKSLHPNTFLSIRRHLRFLEEKVNKHRNEEAGLLLFDPVFSVEQLQSLSQRTKNAILYSQPTTINDWLDKKFFNELVHSFFGDTVLVKTKKRPVFHLKWKAYYQSSQFKDWKRNVALKELLPDSPLQLNLELLEENKKVVIKGIDFDLSESSLNRKLNELKMTRNALADYSIKVVHPVAKRKSGKEKLSETKSKYTRIEFQSFKDFKS